MSASPQHRGLLLQAIELSRRAVPSPSAYSVGCIIVRAGETLASGYSREFGERTHAEEAAIAKAADSGKMLSGATLYASLEPCSQRRSGLRSCAARIIDAGISRVVFALREPPIFIEGRGADMLATAGVDVIEISDDAATVLQINAHLRSSS